MFLLLFSLRLCFVLRVPMAHVVCSLKLHVPFPVNKNACQLVWNSYIRCNVLLLIKIQQSSRSSSSRRSNSSSELALACSRSTRSAARNLSTPFLTVGTPPRRSLHSSETARFRGTFWPFLPFLSSQYRTFLLREFFLSEQDGEKEGGRERAGREGGGGVGGKGGAEGRCRDNRQA